jgi:hypothetical protein
VSLEVAALALLLLKHFLGDFVLQTARQAQFKGVYGHRAGLEHSGIHVLLTVPCLLVVGIAPGAALAAAAAEFVVHYHEDWLKELINRRYGLTRAHKAYWVVLGADQLVHQLTYVAMVAVLM